MAKPKVVVTSWVHPEVIRLLEPACRVVAPSELVALERDEVLRRARDAEGLMAFMTDHVDEAFLDACPALRVVAGVLKGADNFDTEAIRRRGVRFSLCTDLLTVPTAELVMGLMIGVGRNVLAGDRLVRSGDFAGWQPRLYGEGLAERTVGIIGMGAVGGAVAVRAGAFDMRVVYHDRAGVTPPEGVRARPVEMDELLRTSDYVVPLPPLTSDTFHLIGREALARMRPTTFLVNAGRGSVVDEEAVADALESGRLAGYAADVFELEDWARGDGRPAELSSRLRSHPRTLFTPHLGSAVDGVRRAAAKEAAGAILSVLGGR